eukprot:SAG11_NODE_652_length_7925_cov_3.950166_5_plen_62_part_00
MGEDKISRWSEATHGSDLSAVCEFDALRVHQTELRLFWAAAPRNHALRSDVSPPLYNLFFY